MWTVELNERAILFGHFGPAPLVSASIASQSGTQRHRAGSSWVDTLMHRQSLPDIVRRERIACRLGAPKRKDEISEFYPRLNSFVEGNSGWFFGQ